MTSESISFEALAEARKRSAQACSEFQSRTKRRFPYGLETALELQGIEKPNLPPGTTAYQLPVAVLPNVNAKTHLTGINRVIWSFPVETIHIAGTYLCTTPACTWAMYKPSAGSAGAGGTGRFHDATRPSVEMRQRG